MRPEHRCRWDGGAGISPFPGANAGRLSDMSLLARYLDRLGATDVQSDEEPVEMLDRLLARHAAAIPFENLGPLTGAGVSIEPGAIAAKLIDAGRGGYCHEHALLSQQVLTELGFRVHGVLARVYRDPGITTPSAPTHHATVVRVAEQYRLFDPGFGGGTPTATLAVASGEQVGDFRIVPAAEVLPEHLQATDVELMLQRRSGQGVWHNVYGFALTPAQPADVMMSNWFVSTSPEVMFTTTPVLATHGLDGSRHMLRGRQLRSVCAGTENTRTVASLAEFREVVDSVFKIRAGEELITAAWQKA